jgi:hypothetical protein
LGWEHSLVLRDREVTPGVYRSLVNMFALHRPGTPPLLPALRRGWPYQAHQMSWYERGELTDEGAHYLGRAIAGQYGSSWAEAA